MSDTNFHKTRWLYKRDGRDVGPFRPHELKDLLKQKALTETTQVRELTSTEWRVLQSVPGFADLIRAAATELERHAEDRKASKQRVIPWVAISSAILILGGVGGYFGWQYMREKQPLSTSGIPTDLLRTLDLQTLPERAYLDTRGPIKWAEEKVALREVKAGATATKPKRRPVAAQSAPGEARAVGADDLADDPAAVQEIDFSATADEGRELGPGELAMVRQSAISKLLGCAQAEAERSETFNGTTVQFSLLPTGSIGNIKLGQNGANSAAFGACARGALAGISVKPFGGGAEVIRVPLKIGR